MPKGYFVVRSTVTNAAQFAEFAAKAGAAAIKHGGRFLARGGRVEAPGGDGRARHVIIEFASFEAARAYFHSPEYVEASKLRRGAATVDIAIVEGLPE